MESPRKTALLPRALMSWFSVAGSLALVGPLAAEEPRDEWPRYAHDGALTGCTALRGDIEAPREAWTFSTAGKAFTLELVPADGEHALVLPPQKAPEPQAAAGLAERWDLGPRRLDLDGSGKPEDNIGETTATRHARVDLDGDGRFEIASAGYSNGVRAIDPATGKVFWSFAAPEPTEGKVSAANIDGRGGDELLYPAGDRLVVVTGDRGGGRILWTWQGPGALSLPAIADVDGDGKAEIVLQSADGVLHCLDGPPR